MIDCPDQPTLLRLLCDDALDDPGSDVSVHVQECQHCQSVLDALLEQSNAPEADAPKATRLTVDSTDESAWNDERRARIAQRLDQAMSTAPIGDLELPCKLGDYELIEVLGEGGMGVVYRARQVSLNRIVAVKVISRGRLADQSLVKRFLREAESAAMLDHPGIVPIMDVGEASGRVFYAMGFVSGGSLAEATSQQPMTSRAAAKCLHSIAVAIEYAHSRGIIHRDLKPSNVLRDESGTIRIADFGLAKQLGSDADLTATGQVLGTPSYMPPEQARASGADVQVAGDVYSMGAVLFHLLTGRPPFVAAEPVDVMHQLVHDDPISPRQLNPSVPRDLETITLKCLAKQPDHRYESARLLADELQRYLDGHPIHARPMGPIARTWRWANRNRIVAGLTAAIVLLLISSSLISGYLGLQARDQARLANKQSRLANEQADGVLRILETMLFDLQPPYQSDGAAQAERGEMLTTVLSELERLPAADRNAQRILRCRATALLGLADTAMQAGNDDGFSGSTGSIAFYQQAIEIFQSRHLADPDDLNAQHELAVAMYQCGETYANERQWKPARELFFAALPILRDVVAANPEDSLVQLDLANLEASCAEAHGILADNAAAEVLFLSAYERSGEQFSRRPDDRRTGLTHARSCRMVGAWYLGRGQLDLADERRREAVDINVALARRYPSDFDIQMDCSTAYERLGDVSQRRGKLELACQQYGESLQYAERLGLAAPDNDQIQWDISFSHEKLAEIYRRLSRLEDSANAALQCVELRRGCVARSPKVAFKRSKLTDALSALATNQHQLGDDRGAEASTREAIENLQDFHRITGSDRFAAEIKRLSGVLANRKSP